MKIHELIRMLKEAPDISVPKDKMHRNISEDRFGPPYKVQRVEPGLYLAKRIADKLTRFPADADVTFEVDGFEDFDSSVFKTVMRIKWDKGEYKFFLVPSQAAPNILIDAEPLPLSKKDLRWLTGVSTSPHAKDKGPLEHIHQSSDCYYATDGHRIHAVGGHCPGDAAASFTTSGVPVETSMLPIGQMLSNDVLGGLSAFPVFEVIKSKLPRGDRYHFVGDDSGIRVETESGSTPIGGQSTGDWEFWVNPKYFRAAIVGKTAEVAFYGDLIQVISDDLHRAYIARWEPDNE